MINVNNNYKDMKTISPFKLCVLTNFPFIEADFDAVTNYQLLCKVVEYLNNVIDNSNTQNSNISQLERNFIVLYNYVKDYFDNLDVQEEINKKLDEMAADGSLDKLIKPYFDEYKKTIDGDIKTQNDKITVLENRMNSFTSLPSGSTTGDAELIDIRVPASGFNYNETYSTAGEAVRGQVSALKGDLSNLKLKYYVNDKITDKEKNYEVRVEHLKSGNLCIEVKNDSDSPAYISVKLYNGEKEVYRFTHSTAYEAGETRNVENITIYENVTNIKINNVNSANVNLKVYSQYNETVFESDKINNEFNALFHNKIDSFTWKGYLNKDGEKIVQSATSENDGITVNNVIPGSVFKYSGGYSSFVLVCGYYKDGTAIPLLRGRAKKYENEYIYIEDENIVKVNAWSDSNVSKLVFEYVNFNNVSHAIDNINKRLEKIGTRVVVDSNGDGDFTDLKEAISFLKSNYDVENIPAVVFVRNGIYNFEPIPDRPMIIHKGFNKISIIGETRDGVILSLTCNGMAQNKLLDIGGECTIENMTIKVLNDGTYTTENDLGHNPYCIHIDEGDGKQENRYYTTIKNCRLYSECLSPIGAGLHDKQIQRFVDCELISNNKFGTEKAGALYVHASVESYANDMGVEIDNCTCISKDGSKALSLPNVSPSYGSLKYTDIDVSIRRTICVSNGNTVTNVSKTTHRMTTDCALNNVESLNY